MPPSESSLQEVYRTIVDCYSRDELRRVVGTCLKENYDLLVSSEKSYLDQAFDFVQWAERQGRLQELANCLERARPAPAPGEPPYMGLAYFGVADAALFYGRETLVKELATYLKEHRFLAVVGASGSGKSSVVRAGVAAALLKGEAVKGSDKWLIHIVTPTARPLQALAAELTKESESVTAQATLMDDLAKDARSLDLFASRLLARTGAPRLVIVIDQFEELFTLCKDRAEQQAYLDNLLTAAVPDGATTVILTLRADFYARCAEFAKLRAALQDYQKYIGPMAHDELRTAIEAPAVQNGWNFEPGLIDAILDDVEGEAGALPLLSHALLETWNRRSERTMTFAGYHAAGGVQGAIAKTADGVYAELPPEQQAIARGIFLRLTTLGEGVQDTRRRAPLPELLGSGDQTVLVQAVLKRLEDERLVTAERSTTAALRSGESGESVYVDVTHEALIRAWPRLGAWLNEDREGLLIHRRLTEAAQEWQELEHDPGALFRGSRLAQTTEWAVAHDGDLNDLERQFLGASRALADSDKRRRRRITGGIVLGSVLFAIAMAVLAIVANNLRNDADTARHQAQENLGLAQQKLDDLQVEELLASARSKRNQLDVLGAVEDLKRAAAAAGERGKALDVAGDISDTVGYVATRWVQAGEALLRATSTPALSRSPALTVSVTIQPGYLAWAFATAPQLAGWSSDIPLARQQAIISATALFSQALALNPPADTLVYEWVAPGLFTMGAPDGDTAAEPIEKPAHAVELHGFWIQRTEVTNRQYRACVEAGVCTPPNNERWPLAQFDLQPVTEIDWEQARTYAGWAGGTLPTEAEWEKACRSSDGRIYPWGNESPTPDRLNMYTSGLRTWMEVGSFPAGANGLFDMAGNVWEWTNSAQAPYPYDPNDGRENVGADQEHVMRGGSFTMESSSARCTARFKVLGNLKFDNLGLRVAVTARGDRR
ncbi:MAG: SUMF1/EgtB/PvdO family nonheme iron enzyme [Caldilineaceae bacterium]